MHIYAAYRPRDTGNVYGICTGYWLRGLVRVWFMVWRRWAYTTVDFGASRKRRSVWHCINVRSPDGVVPITYEVRTSTTSTYLLSSCIQLMHLLTLPYG